MAKLADARDLKSRGAEAPSGFESQLRHQTAGMSIPLVHDATRRSSPSRASSAVCALPVERPGVRRRYGWNALVIMRAASWAARSSANPDPVKTRQVLKSTASRSAASSASNPSLRAGQPRARVWTRSST